MDAPRSTRGGGTREARSRKLRLAMYQLIILVFWPGKRFLASFATAVP